LNIIFSSDLIKQLFEGLFNLKDRKMKYFFNGKDSIEELWNNIILFIPFKLTGISGFSYRHILKIFISIYMICHFNTEIENEIFNLGAFVRVIIHEIMGHFFISYRYFMFFANINNSDKEDSPRMEEQMKTINKNIYIECVGKKLAEISYEVIKKSKGFSEEEENNLTNKLENIIGNEYARTLAKKLLEKEKKNKVFSNITKNDKNGNSPDSQEEKNKLILQLSEEITNILFDSIFEEFDRYLLESNIIFKEHESGNVAEFLLFNDFSQNITLKQCMFLLNEENYMNTNLFNFRTEFKKCKTIKNDDFLEKLNKKLCIFGETFSKYISVYYKDGYQKNNLTSPKTFRGNFENNLNRECHFFTCHFVGIRDLESPEKFNQD
jgi:hypothetical protein